MADHVVSPVDQIYLAYYISVCQKRHIHSKKHISVKIAPNW